ncbi:hypothetical protein HY634_01945 [Candidatus Uhrbacteria bacterium]|nr:hypothetical protein [Candidatus Uhrbacteria bacterium]
MPSTQRGIFTYEIPEDLSPRCVRGAFVLIPFRVRRVWGLILRTPSQEPVPATTRLRGILRVSAEAILNEDEVMAMERLARLFRASYATTAYLTLPTPPTRAMGSVSKDGVMASRRHIRVATENLAGQLLRPSSTTLAIFHTHPQRLAAIRAAAAAILHQRKNLLIITPHRAWLEPIRAALHEFPCVLLDRTAGRIETWRQTLAARMPGVVILGTRATAFTAPPSLGAIIIDHAEDDDLKQEDAEPRYDARDVTAVIAHGRRIPRLLLTAAPRAVDWAGDVHRIDLGPPPDPRWTLVDLLTHWRSGERGFITEPLASAITRAHAAGRIAVLFHNRRGRMHRITCRDCGTTIRCAACSQPLVEHPDGLQCHRCGSRSSARSLCPTCQSPHLVGHGVGTAGIAEALHRSFPDLRIARVDRDAPAIPTSYFDVLVASERFTASLAPSFHRPIGLAAVLHAERLVRGDDYRTDEILVQAIRNITVWAHTWDAETIVQTSAPDRALWSALPTNLSKFYRSEIEERTALGYPPGTRYIRCDRIGPDGERAGAALTHLIQSRKPAIVRSVDTPAIAKAGPRLRTTVLLRIDAHATDEAIAALTAVVPPEWSIDIDPTTLIA